MQLRQNYRNFWHTDLMGTIQADTPCILSLSLSLTFSLYKHRYTLFCIYVCMYVYGISFLLIRLCFSACVFVQIAALRFFGKCYLDLLNLNFELELVDLDCVVDFWVFEELFWLWLGIDIGWLREFVLISVKIFECYFMPASLMIWTDGWVYWPRHKAADSIELLH